MPVVKTATISFALTYIELDINLMNANCKLTRKMDGLDFGEIEFQISGADLGAILQEVPGSAKNLADHVADSVYAHALAKGYVSGQVI